MAEESSRWVNILIFVWARYVQFGQNAQPFYSELVFLHLLNGPVTKSFVFYIYIVRVSDV